MNNTDTNKDVVEALPASTDATSWYLNADVPWHFPLEQLRKDYAKEVEECESSIRVERKAAEDAYNAIATMGLAPRHCINSAQRASDVALDALRTVRRESTDYIKWSLALHKYRSAHALLVDMKQRTAE